MDLKWNDNEWWSAPSQKYASMLHIPGKQKISSFGYLHLDLDLGFDVRPTIWILRNEISKAIILLWKSGSSLFWIWLHVKCVSSTKRVSGRISMPTFVWVIWFTDVQTQPAHQSKTVKREFQTAISVIISQELSRLHAWCSIAWLLSHRENTAHANYDTQCFNHCATTSVHVWISCQECEPLLKQRWHDG